MKTTRPKTVFTDGTDAETTIPAAPAQAQHGRYSIKEGQNVLHVDHHGQSEGIADSDAMMSSNRIKISFTSGPRKGECRWVPLAEVISNSRPTELKDNAAQAQHSPLPWKIQQTSEATLDIVYSDGEILSRIAQLNVYTLADEHSNGGIEANARYIVRACNNAQRLTEFAQSVAALDLAAVDCGMIPVDTWKRIHANAREALAEWSKSI